MRDTTTQNPAGCISIPPLKDITYKRQINSNSGSTSTYSSVGGSINIYQGGNISTSSNPLAKRFKKRKCKFGNAEIMEFEPSVWNSSVPSSGVPVGLSSRLRRTLRRRVDSFEMERDGTCESDKHQKRIGRQNFMREGYLLENERESILTRAGNRSESFDHVENECREIRGNRELTNTWIEHEIEMEFPCTKICEDALEHLSIWQFLKRSPEHMLSDMGGISDIF